MSVVSPDFKFEVDSEGLASRCYRSQMPSEAASYGLGDRVLIPIPPVHNGFLDCSQSFLNISYTFCSCVLFLVFCFFTKSSF